MKTIAYLDFDLQIERAGSTYRAQVLNSPAGQATHTFSLPFSELELENYLLRLGGARPGMRSGKTSAIETARTFGERLFETVFDGEVQLCLDRSLDYADQQEKGLRLRLRLTDAPDLVDVPWEYLYNRKRDRFYALSRETPLVRYLEMPERIEPLAHTPPLRALVVIASPRGYPALDAEREWQHLKQAVQALEERGLLVLERLEQATLPALQRRLRTSEYHIFHFVGHGDFDPQAQDGALILEDAKGMGCRVSSQTLSMLFRDHRHSLRLAILNACEGGHGSPDDPCAGTAQRLVQQGIPAVIAMQFEIADTTAITFAQEFYSAIADGYPVDAALTEARKAISFETQGAEWGTPVLYMRAPDGRVFDMGQPSPAPIAAADDSPQEQSVGAQPTIIYNINTGGGAAITGSTFDTSPIVSGGSVGQLTAADSVAAGSPPARPDTPEVAAAGAAGPVGGAAALSLEAPEGTVRIGSPFYTLRASDHVAHKVIGQEGATITIKGPRQIGKSSLLVRLADTAKQAGKCVVTLDFQEFDRATLASADQFFRLFCARIAYKLRQEDKLDECWNTQFGNIMRCTDYFEQHLLANLSSPLVLALDEVDRLFEADFRSDFFGMLRSWHNERSSSHIWRPVDLVLVTSTEPYQLIDNLNQSPFNVGEVIELADFTPGQIVDLNACHGAPLSAAQVQQLTELVGGHPYLTRKALYEVAIGHSSAQLLFQDATSDQSPFATHLSHHLTRLNTKEELTRGMAQVIRSQTCPDDQVFSRLQSAGLVRRERGAVVPRCQLYADYFRERLHV